MADMSRDAVLEWLQTIFDDDVPFVGHNIKFDYLLLRRNGVKMKVVHFDTMLAAFECHGDWDFYNLAYVSQRLLGKKIKSYGDVVGENRTFLDLPLKVMVNHAGQDADMALRLYPVLLAQLKERGIAAQYFEGTVPLIAQLAELELHGLRVKEHGIDRVRRCLAKRAAHLRAMICDRLGGDCDLDSLKDVTEKLEAALGRETVGRPRRLTISALEGLARSEPIVQLIVRYRRLRRQIAEVESISMAVRDKRVHPLFNQIRSPAGIVATDAPCLLVLGEFPSLAACFEADVNQFCVDKQRALDLLARASGDRRLRMDLVAKPKSVRHIASRPLIRELDQQELLLSCAIGYSDAAMTRRFLVDTAAVSETRCDLRRRYPVLFDWLDAYRREAEKTGYGSFEGKRKYIDGLRSSNIGKRAKALENVVRWLVRF
jgi:DNA polymerase-1